MGSLTHRRTWDLKAYQLKDTKEDIAKQKDEKITKKKQIVKNYSIDLKSKVKIGKVNIVNPSNLKNSFYCSICDVLKHDSSSYLSHMNSRAHLKSIGGNLAVEKSSLIQVQKRLNSKKDSNKKVEAIKPKKTKGVETNVEPECSEMNKLMGFSSFGKK